MLVAVEMRQSVLIVGFGVRQYLECAALLRELSFATYRRRFGLSATIQEYYLSDLANLQIQSAADILLEEDGS